LIGDEKGCDFGWVGKEFCRGWSGCKEIGEAEGGAGSGGDMVVIAGMQVSLGIKVGETMGE
jgi:hypothetical protein